MKYRREIKFIGAVITSLATLKIVQVMDNAKEYFPAHLKEIIKDSRTEETKSVFTDKENLLAKTTEILNHKETMAKNMMSDWKTEHNIDVRKKEIDAAMKTAKVKAKESCNFDIRMTRIREDEQVQLKLLDEDATYKKALKEKTDALEKIKADRKREVQQYDLMESLSPTEEAKEAVRKARKSAKKAYESNRENAVSALNELKEQHSKDAAAIHNKAKELEQALNAEFTDAIHKESADIVTKSSALNTEIDMEKLAIDKAVKDSYTDEEKGYFDRLNEVRNKERIIRQEEMDMAKKMIEEADLSTVMGTYLKKNGYSKLEVFTIGTIPTIPVLLVLYRYFIFMVRILKSL